LASFHGKNTCVGGSRSAGLRFALAATHMKFQVLPLLLVLLTASSAWAANSGDASVIESSPPRRHWYGWQTALVDAASLSLGASVAALSDQGHDSDVSGAVGGIVVASYVLGGPIVHAAHGQWGTAGASLGLRLGAPVGGALGGLLLGYAVCPRHDDRDVPCSAVTAGVGGFLGFATALVVDSAVLAYEPEPNVNGPQGVRLVPIVIAERNHWGAGIGGSF